MGSVLEQLTADADLVILDSTPLLMVSDAFPLLDKVSGVVPLARLDKTPRDAIRRMVQIIGSAGGQVLGIVATDGKKLIKTGYGYGYGYGSGYGDKKKRKREASGSTNDAPPVVNPADAVLPPALASRNGNAETAAPAPGGASSAERR